MPPALLTEKKEKTKVVPKFINNKPNEANVYDENNRMIKIAPYAMRNRPNVRWFVEGEHYAKFAGRAGILVPFPGDAEQSSGPSIDEVVARFSGADERVLRAVLSVVGTTSENQTILQAMGFVNGRMAGKSHPAPPRVEPFVIGLERVATAFKNIQRAEAANRGEPVKDEQPLPSGATQLPPPVASVARDTDDRADAEMPDYTQGGAPPVTGIEAAPARVAVTETAKPKKKGNRFKIGRK